MALDYILNGKGYGKVATRLMKCGGDLGVMQPFEGPDGKSYITVNNNGKPKVMLTNADATLRYDEWKILEETVLRESLPRLKLVADLRANPSTTLTIPNALSKTVFTHQRQSDYGEAQLSMDGRNRGKSDAPVYDLVGVPLPILTADFEIGLRELLESRNHGATALDLDAAAKGGRRIAELAEQMAIGTAATFAYASYSIYGLTNFPSRNTYTLNSPTGAGWVPEDTFDDVQAMVDVLKADHFYGPYRLYHGSSWAKYMAKDFSAAKGSNTLRDRILDIEQIESVRELDYLTGYNMVLVQMSGDVIRELVGFDLRTVQWEEEGGWAIKMKIIAMLIPQPRAERSGQCGICHGNV